MTPAQELAAAADKLDALASKATEGPWVVSKRDGGTILGIDGGQGGYDEVVQAGQVQCGSYCYGGTSRIEMSEADAAYISAMNPLRGKALAVVLREASYTIDNNVNILVPRGLPAVPVSGGLLDLARMVNGSAS